MQSVINHQVKALSNLATKILQRGEFCLVDIICFDAILFKKYPLVKISSKYLRVHAIVAKGAQRCAGLTLWTHVGQHIGVVGAKPYF